MTDELFESFKRAIQADNLQTALADFEASVESYSDWRFYDPLTESVSKLHRFFDRELRSANYLKRNATTDTLAGLRAYDAATTLKSFDSVAGLRPKLIEEFEGKIKRARKPERKLELTQALANEDERFRVLTVLVHSATRASCLVDKHFKSLVHGGGVIQSRGMTVANELRVLARVRNRVFTRPSIQSFEEYTATTDLVLNKSPKLRKIFLTVNPRTNESDWDAYLATSQNLIDELEVAVMVQSL